MVFKNPTSYWEHQGSYSVVLTDDATTDHLPTGVSVRGKTVSVPRGRIKQVMGGIQFYADEQPFSWGYKFIKEVRDGNDNLVWQNYNYR